MRPALLAVVVVGCQRHAMPPPAGPDQSVHDAMVLVCAAPERADGDRRAATKSDAIAGHLTDGVGNPKVLSAAEAWKTDGVDRKQLEALVKEAKLTRCALRDEMQ